MIFGYASPIRRGGRGRGLYAIDLASNAIRRLPLPEQEAAALRAWTVARDGKSVVAAQPAGSITRVVAIPTGGQSAERKLFTVTSPVWYLEAARDQSLFVNPICRLSTGRFRPDPLIAPGKGVIRGLTASADGGTLYFCAGGSVWTRSIPLYGTHGGWTPSGAFWYRFVERAENEGDGEENLACTQHLDVERFRRRRLER